MELIVRELLRQTLVFVAQARRVVVRLREGALAQAAEHGQNRGQKRGYQPLSRSPVACWGFGKRAHGCPLTLAQVAGRRAWTGSWRAGRPRILAGGGMVCTSDISSGHIAW